jgi:hypothetical protein
VIDAVAVPQKAAAAGANTSASQAPAAGAKTAK